MAIANLVSQGAFMKISVGLLLFLMQSYVLAGTGLNKNTHQVETPMSEYSQHVLERNDALFSFAPQRAACLKLLNESESRTLFNAKQVATMATLLEVPDEALHRCLLKLLTRQNQATLQANAQRLGESLGQAIQNTARITAQDRALLATLSTRIVDLESPAQYRLATLLFKHQDTLFPKSSKERADFLVQFLKVITGKLDSPKEAVLDMLSSQEMDNKKVNEAIIQFIRSEYDVYTDQPRAIEKALDILATRTVAQSPDVTNLLLKLSARDRDPLHRRDHDDFSIKAIAMLAAAPKSQIPHVVQSLSQIQKDPNLSPERTIAVRQTLLQLRSTPATAETRSIQAQSYRPRRE